MVVTMLIYTASLALQLPSCVTIHNQCSNTKLASPIYFGSGAACPKISGQQMDIGTKMMAHFEIKATRDAFEGALLFKLQRYSNSQHNMDTSTAKINKNEATHIHMLTAWKVENFKPLIYVTLIEHAKEFTWNKDKLKKLYDKNRGWLKEYYGITPYKWLMSKEHDNTTSYTWLIDDNMALKVIFRVRGLGGNFELNISISEEERDDYAIRPLCVDLKR
jgi:hypothetical protein